MRYVTPIAALLTISLIGLECSAQPPGRRNRAENAQQRDGQKRDGQRRPDKGQRPGPGGDRDPEQMVARMMKEFDKDGDSKLDLTELAAMMKSMRERRENGGQRGRGEGGNAEGRRRPPEAGKEGQRPGKEGRQGRGKGQQDEAPGGEKPTRPPAE